jgi:hypothetical protein
MTPGYSTAAPMSVGPMSRTVQAEGNIDSVDGSSVAQPNQERIVTRSKHGISKPKIYSDGTI